MGCIQSKPSAQAKAESQQASHVTQKAAFNEPELPKSQPAPVSDTVDESEVELRDECANVPVKPASVDVDASEVDGTKGKADGNPGVNTRQVALKDDGVSGSAGRGRLRFSAEEFVAPKESYKPMANPKKGLIKSKSYVGSALLAMAKQHPALQPVAYTLGAVVASAVSARSLRQDSARLAKILAQVESALVKLGSQAEANLGTLDELLEVLDDCMETLQILKKPMRAGVFPPEVLEIACGGGLSNLRDRLTGALKSIVRIGDSVSEDLSFMDAANFKESKAAAAKDQPASAAEAGPTRYADSVSEMADAVLDSAEIKSIQALRESEDLMEFEEPEPLSEDPALLDLEADIMHRQVQVMSAMAESSGMKPSFVRYRFPLPEKEAERLEFVKKNKLDVIAKTIDVEEVMDSLRTAFKSTYLGAYIAGNEFNYLLEAQIDGRFLGKESGLVIRQKGRVVARKFSICQRTIAAKTHFFSLPVDKMPECFDGSMFGNQQLCMADSGVADMGKRLATPGSDPVLEEFLHSLQAGGKEAMEGIPVRHFGQSIIMNGHKVGALCIFHDPEAWGPEAKETADKAVRQLAERLSVAAGITLDD